MSLNVNNVNGGSGGYGVSWNHGSVNNGNEDVNEKQTEAQKQPEFKEVNESEVWDFLMNSSSFVAQVKAPEAPANASGAAAGMEQRAADCMPNFELAFALIQEEFGEEVATLLMNNDDFVDKLLEYFG